MKTLKTLKTLAVCAALLSPFSANAFDSELEFQGCIKQSLEEYHDNLTEICSDYCPEDEQKAFTNVSEVLHNNFFNDLFIFKKVHKIFDAEYVFMWGVESGLNTINAEIIANWAVRECGVQY
ncbi:hypothetical protein [Moritella sp. 28]|uniref:hypothetical protein n=1 Tax=Moritella sp. 28 TaxID=2746232 RepID=UPI001BAA687A|nr:hypothetical protein [Moritella sp. 28]QUM85505.1 hypothetical protein HWV02_13815 [Moritella sp. 28]